MECLIMVLAGLVIQRIDAAVMRRKLQRILRELAASYRANGDVDALVKEHLVGAVAEHLRETL